MASTSELMEVNRDLMEKLKEQDDLLKILTTPPLKPATVVAISETDKTAVVVVDGGSRFVVEIPRGLKIVNGSYVALNLETFQIVKTLKMKVAGDVGTCVALKDSYAEVEMGGMKKMLNYNPDTSPKIGDELLADSTNSVIIQNMGKPISKASTFETTSVNWEDIGGQESAKAALREAIELPYIYGDMYKRYGKKPMKGVLLYGPPGCGKTLLGKATATALAGSRNGTSGGFIYVKGPELLNKFVGETELSIRALFMQAKTYKEKTGKPAVIFIDEAESLLSRRGSGVSSDMEKTIVPAFLAEMDGMEENSAFVLLATNRADRLDSAVVRDGRINRKVKVDRPDTEAAIAIFNIHLKGVPTYDKSRSELAAYGAKAIYDMTSPILTVNMKDGSSFGLKLSDIMSGAMVAGVVDRATTKAINREISGDKKRGILVADIKGAIEDVYVESLNIDHDEALNDMLDGAWSGVANVTKASS